MLRWFQALMPKEERFFPLFEEHARLLVAGADSLRGLLEGGAAVPERCRAIVAHEGAADVVTREVLQAVRRTFITPFDRTAIKDLIQAMDDALDEMNQVAKSVTRFEVTAFEPQLREMGDVVVQATAIVAEAVPLLRALGPNAARLAALTEEVVRLEGRADDLYDQGLRRLYEAHGRTDPMAYLIGSELYERVEGVVDRLEDVADEISAIVIEGV